MQLLVGIPTHRRPGLLRECLASVETQEGELPSISVFVADNDPAGREGVKVVDELAGSFRFPISSTIVEEPGISAVRNAILAEARARGVDFIAMIDDDEVASRQWLAELLKTQAAYEADVVGGPVTRDTPMSAPPWMRAGIFRVQSFATGPIKSIDATGNVLMAAEALRRFEWPQFDPHFGLSGGGDTEYFLRLLRFGATFAWAQDAKVDEPVPPTRYTTGWFLKRQFRHGNIGYRLGLLHGHPIVPRRTWALKNLLASPLLLLLALSPAMRLKALKRLAYSAGIISSHLGYTYLEYAERHNRPRPKMTDAE